MDIGHTDYDRYVAELRQQHQLACTLRDNVVGVIKEKTGASSLVFGGSANLKNSTRGGYDASSCTV